MSETASNLSAIPGKATTASIKTRSTLKCGVFYLSQQRVYDQVIAELLAGCKRTHWMWFIFPQLDGLGESFMAQKFAICSREQALEYLYHPILGARLTECTAAILRAPGTAEEILGEVDAQKFCSSMTLFAAVSKGYSIFDKALAHFFDNNLDDYTLDFLLKDLENRKGASVLGKTDENE
jgi:uncharacterized protein (DUF1810 family)